MEEEVEVAAAAGGEKKAENIFVSKSDFLSFFLFIITLFLSLFSLSLNSHSPYYYAVATLKLFTIALSSDSALRHCLGLADAANRKSLFLYAVAATSLRPPTLPPGPPAGGFRT